MIYMVDSSAWIEYFSGSDVGIIIREIIEKEKLITSILVIAELADKYLREGKPFHRELLFLQSKVSIIPMNVNIALQGAKIKTQRRPMFPKFGLVDALILATAQLHKATLLTKDNDFRGIENVTILK